MRRGYIMNRYGIKLITVVLLFLGPLLALHGDAADLHDGFNFLKELSSAPGNVKLGPVALHAGLGMQYDWDDNIYRTSQDKTEDHMTDIMPGLLFKMGGDYSFQAGYAVNRYRYDENEKEDFTERHGLAALNLKFPSGLLFSLEDRYLKTQAPRDNEDNPTRAGYWNNMAVLGLGYMTSSRKLGGKLSVTNNTLKFSDDENGLYDKRDYSGTLTGFYTVFSKTQLLLGAGHAQSNFTDREKEALNSKSYSGFAGILWEATSRFQGTLKTGIHQKIIPLEDYDNAEIWTADASVTWKPPASSISKVDLSFKRDIFDSSYVGNPIDKLSASIFYKRSAFDLAVFFRTSYKMSFYIKTGYHFHDYIRLEQDLDPRKDRVTVGGIGFRYKILEWFQITASYSYMKQLSNDDSRDQSNNRVYLSTIMYY